MNKITPPDLDLSIIIISYNTRDLLHDCIESIVKSKWRSKIEIIVVDNNSKDGSVEMIKEKHPEVRLIENKENRLFAIANNQGAEIARGRYLLLLNSDTIVYDDNLQRMVDYFDTLSEDVICIGPKVLNRDKSLQSCGFPNSGIMERIVMCFKLHRILSTKVVRNFLLSTMPLNSNTTCTVGWVVGAAMMMRADL